ncbi:hypothetical protein HY994_01190 [Candidatus Micrarchaeota archaeon]|nr:hypothetical protein [Candidatus Micrarchaeota archaeon]
MRELLEALEKDSRFKIDYPNSHVFANQKDMHGNHDVHVHLKIEPNPATVLELGVGWFAEKKPEMREKKAMKFWMDLITNAVRTHAPDAEPAWSFESTKGKKQVTIGAVQTMGRNETHAFMAFARSKGIS